MWTAASLILEHVFCFFCGSNLLSFFHFCQRWHDLTKNVEIKTFATIIRRVSEQNRALRQRSYDTLIVAFKRKDKRLIIAMDKWTIWRCCWYCWCCCYPPIHHLRTVFRTKPAKQPHRDDITPLLSLHYRDALGFGVLTGADGAGVLFVALRSPSAASLLWAVGWTNVTSRRTPARTRRWLPICTPSTRSTACTYSNCRIVYRFRQYTSQPENEVENVRLSFNFYETIDLKVNHLKACTVNATVVGPRRLSLFIEANLVKQMKNILS